MTLVDRITGIEASVAVKAPCITATVANITLSGEQTINGVAVSAGDRVLVKDQTNGVDNGIWVCATGAWSRAEDFNGTRDAVTGTMVLAIYGDVALGATWYVDTAGDIVIGTTALTFSKRRVSDSLSTIPQDFGATGDGVTDDSAAINTWAAYLRTNGIKGEWPGGTYFCGTTTLHLAQCTIRGAGAPGNNRWTGSMTEVLSNANPIWTNTNGTNDSAFGRLDIENVLFAGAGGTVATIDLWDKAGYTGQIGGRLGWLTMEADAGVPEDSGDDFSQGFGTNRVVNCGFQDISGFGLYLYKSWGDSIISDLNFRCCGGKAAYDYGVLLGDEAEGDHWGGDICIASSSVDTEFERCHSLGSGHASGTLPNADYDNRGTMFKIGARKTNTDPLFRDYLSPNKINATACHCEGRMVFCDVLSTKWSVFDKSNINGGATGALGKVLIGYASNPSTDLRMQWSNTRVGSAAGFWLMQGNQVNLGNLHNATPGVATPIYYWRGTAFELLGAEHGQRTPADVGWTISPQEDPTAMPGGSGITDESGYLPFAASSALPTDQIDNELPSYNGGSGTTLTGWSSTGLGTATVDASGTFATLEGGKVVTSPSVTVTEGEVMTARVYVRSASSFGGGNVVVRILDTSDAIIFRRNMGVGSQPAGLYRVEFNFLAPAGGVAKLQITAGDADPIFVDFCAPRIVRGLAPASPPTIPALWAASDGIYATA